MNIVKPPYRLKPLSRGDEPQVTGFSLSITFTRPKTMVSYDGTNFVDDSSIGEEAQEITNNSMLNIKKILPIRPSAQTDRS
jgi:hypothetical protein